MRMLSLIMLLCMLLAVSGRRPISRQGGVPCALLDLTHPGGWSGVSRSGHTCYVSSPPATGMTRDARRVLGRAVRGERPRATTTACRVAWLLPPAGGAAC